MDTTSLRFSVSSSLDMILQFIHELPEIILLASHHIIISVGAALVVLYLAYRRRAAIYLLDFTCYRPTECHRLPMSLCLEHFSLDDDLDPESVAFQIRVLEKSGLSDETCVPPSMTRTPVRKSLPLVSEETAMVMFSAVTELLKKNDINPKAIDILITNCSTFSPTPSLSAMIINRFKMRSNIMSFNLSGMGCSAGVISVSLAKDMLRAHGNSLALIVTSEAVVINWYNGKNPSMLLTNCLFRMGGAALLMSSRDQDQSKAKYELQHLVRTNKAQDDRSYTCVFQDVDSENKEGVSISRSLLHVAGDAMTANISSLGPMVLPFSEKLRCGLSVVHRMISKASLYTPDFKKAFQHFCIHAGGKAVIQAIEKNLQLRTEDVEASKMTLYRFGNTSSSSIWYELSYIEAKGRMKQGDKVWQLAFGSGFKCNSAVWKCLSNIGFDITNAWSDKIHSYPVEVPDSVKIFRA